MSFLAVHEYFESQDPRFLDELRAQTDPGRLASFVERWWLDPRPWARQMLAAYLRLPMDRPGHQIVVKRLFKRAERAADLELMPLFLSLFDRMVRRELRWNRLVVPRRSVLYSSRRGHPRTGAPVLYRSGNGRPRLLFSYRTRYYLRRRAWRFFRRLAVTRPVDFLGSLGRALGLYRDADLARGENLLDSWSLMNACFRHHPALLFGSTHVRLARGHGLDELLAAPRFPELWRRPEAFEPLLRLASGAEARLVRLFAIELLRRSHRPAFRGIPASMLPALLEHPAEETRGLALELLEALPPENLELELLLKLARMRSTPVASLALGLLKRRSDLTPEVLQTLAGAACAAVAEELTAWALGLAGADRDCLTRFLDSETPEIRRTAWSWFEANPQASRDPILWLRLLETPYEDLRLKLVAKLSAEKNKPAGPGTQSLTGSRGSAPGSGLPPPPKAGSARTRQRAAGPLDALGLDFERMTPVWAAVLLGIRRGGREKLMVLRGMGEALRVKPELAEALLPLLAGAARSIRAPESRAAIAALVTAIEARPELGEAAKRHLPELTCS